MKKYIFLMLIGAVYSAIAMHCGVKKVDFWGLPITFIYYPEESVALDEEEPFPFFKKLIKSVVRALKGVGLPYVVIELYCGQIDELYQPVLKTLQYLKEIGVADQDAQNSVCEVLLDKLATLPEPKAIVQIFDNVQESVGSKSENRDILLRYEQLIEKEASSILDDAEHAEIKKLEATIHRLDEEIAQKTIQLLAIESVVEIAKAELAVLAHGAKLRALETIIDAA